MQHSHYSSLLRFTRSRLANILFRYSDHCAFTSRCVTPLSLSLPDSLTHISHTSHSHTCDDFRLLTFVAWMLPRRSPGLRSAGGSLSLTRTEPIVLTRWLSPVVFGGEAGVGAAAPSFSVIGVGAIDARLEAAPSPPTNDARPPPTVERRADA